MIVDSSATTGRPASRASATSGWICRCMRPSCQRADRGTGRPGRRGASRCTPWHYVEGRARASQRPRAARALGGRRRAARRAHRAAAPDHAPTTASASRRSTGRCPSETVYFRFFAPYPELTERDVPRFTTGRPRRPGRARGHGRRRDRRRSAATTASTPRDAEVAFVVRDDHQGRGLGSVLLEHLAAAARERGVRRFVAEVLPDQPPDALDLRGGGLPPGAPARGRRRLARLRHRAHRVLGRGAAGPRAPRRVAQRRPRWSRPSRSSWSAPGRDPASLGHRLLRHLLEGGFTGRLSAVNRAAAAAGRQQVLGVPTYASVVDVPEPVDARAWSPCRPTRCSTWSTTAPPARRGGAARRRPAASPRAGPDGARPAAAARTPCPRQRHARHRAQRARHRQHRPRGVAQRVARAAACPGARRSGSSARAGRSAARSSRAPCAVASASRPSSRPATAPTSRGNDLLQYWEDDEQHRASCCSTSRASATRASSRRIARRLSRTKPVVAMRTGRSTQAYPLGHTIRRTVAARRRPSTRCSRRPASSRPTRWASCSTSRACSPSSRCPPAGASPSSATPTRSPCWRPTPARRPASTSSATR